MLKVKASLLKFDRVDNLGICFSKDCKINTGDVIPITYPDHLHPIGKITSITQSNSTIDIEGNIDCEIEDEIRSAIDNKDLYAGGYYGIHKEHDDSGTRVMDELTLLSVGIYVDDIYGDKTTSWEVKEDD